MDTAAPARARGEVTGPAGALRPAEAVTRTPRPSFLLVLLGAVALVSCVAALLPSGGAPEPVPAGLPDPGGVTAWGSRLLRPATDLVAVVTVGSLLTAAVLVPGTTGRPLHPAARRAVLTAGRTSVVWAALSVLLLVLTVGEIVGAPGWTVSVDDLRQVAATGTVAPRLVAAALAAVIAAAALGATSPTRARWLTLAALVALVAPAVTGHAASGPDHVTATSGLVVHVLAAAAWIGGLAGLVLHVRRSPDALAASAARFSVLAVGAFIAVAGSGVIAATARLGTSVAAWTSGYAALVLAKAVVLLALGWVGHVHRRVTLPQLAGGAARPFHRLALAELVVMAAAAGLAAALARTPLPAVGPVAEHGLDHPSLPAIVLPVSTVELVTAWRPDAVVLVVVAAAAAAYLTGARRLTRAGRPWPRSRSVAFLSGLGAAVALLCSGVATYSPALVSVHLAQFLGLLLLVPALLAAGSPVALWAAVTDREPPRPVRSVTDPLAGAALVCALVLGTFRTPLVAESVQSPWLHLLLLGLAVLAGTAFLTPLLGRDRRGRRQGSVECVLGLVATAGCLGLLAYQLRYGDHLLAGRYFLDLGWWWADPVADQRLAGAVAAGAALFVVLLLPLAALGARPRR
jgi:cytochrome c oxidase assembly factor CtaG/putative copper export protein